ncbi:MAG: hypothetical protein A3E12_01865 [Candidatus Levybacteria bacterium RIFCSPHIGHO2_12_FULL_39_9]|nr:MAG: hypothetical protein A3E12_01865 [Candidatus Levybacteria bacterium RIFCSPHIGHO2_12_FULL_39_9]
MKGQKFWDQTASDYAGGRTKGRKYILDPALFEIIGNVEGKKVLDIACGDGAITVFLAKKGAICTGIDYSSKLIDIGKNKAKELGLSINFKVMDARNMEAIRNEVLDLIVISLLLPHLSSKADIESVIKQCALLLHKGGRLIISEPHPAFDFYMRNKLRIGDFEYFRSGLPYDFTMNIDGKKLSSIAYHWTLQDYYSAIVNNNFQIDKIIEPRPLDISKGLDRKWYKDRSSYPSYIIFDCIKK